MRVFLGMTAALFVSCLAGRASAAEPVNPTEEAASQPLVQLSSPQKVVFADLPPGAKRAWQRGLMFRQRLGLEPRPLITGGAFYIGEGEDISDEGEFAAMAALLATPGGDDAWRDKICSFPWRVKFVAQQTGLAIPDPEKYCPEYLSWKREPFSGAELVLIANKAGAPTTGLGAVYLLLKRGDQEAYAVVFSPPSQVEEPWVEWPNAILGFMEATVHLKPESEFRKWRRFRDGNAEWRLDLRLSQDQIRTLADLIYETKSQRGRYHAFGRNNSTYILSLLDATGGADRLLRPWSGWETSRDTLIRVANSPMAGAFSQNVPAQVFMPPVEGSNLSGGTTTLSLGYGRLNYEFDMWALGFRAAGFSRGSPIPWAPPGEDLQILAGRLVLADGGVKIDRLVLGSALSSPVLNEVGSTWAWSTHIGMLNVPDCGMSSEFCWRISGDLAVGASLTLDPGKLNVYAMFGPSFGTSPEDGLDFFVGGQHKFGVWWLVAPRLRFVMDATGSLLYGQRQVRDWQFAMSLSYWAGKGVEVTLGHELRQETDLSLLSAQLHF
jgi:hypothetical protein